MLNKNLDISGASTSILEIPTVLKPPISLKFAGDCIACPICEIDIDMKDQLINDDDFAYCEDCNHKVIFKIKKI